MSNRAQRRQSQKLSAKSQSRGKKTFRSTPSLQPKPEVSLSGEPQGVRDYAFGLFNELDGFSHLRGALGKIAERDGSWAGIPMPLDGHRLIIEPKFPNGLALSMMGGGKDVADPDEYKDWKCRNVFWSFRRKTRVHIYQDPDGKIVWFCEHKNPMDRILSIMDCSSAWGLEQEANAVRTLGTLVRHHQFKMYLLTGQFVERSTRSGLLYIFRKLRPTVVLDTSKDKCRIRCTLCMHPIGYYEDTWAGAMTPTDDVIAHLMLMRADEPMLWRRANQHPAYAPESGCGS